MKRADSNKPILDWLWPARTSARTRRRRYRERIDALRDTSLTNDAYFDYAFLLKELNDAELIAELRSTFRREWLQLMRRELVRHLGLRQFALARRQTARMQWEWRQGSGADAPDAIARLIDHLEHPLPEPAPGSLDEVVDGFRAVGIEATDVVVGWLATSTGDPKRGAQYLFSRGGAIGRHLVRRWAERDRVVQAWLATHEAHMPTPVAPAGGPCVYWPRERSESPVTRQGAIRLALDFNPFGPEKAEQDPLLPDLFYRLWPVWQEVTTPQPSVLVAPPGCGRSALMWMMRYESELVGSTLDRILPVHVPVHVPLTSSLLARHLQRAVYGASVCLLARQPDALLGLDDAGQWRLGAFLLEVAGGLPPLFIDLERAGLRTAESDSGLLYQALDRIRDREEPRCAGIDASAVEYETAAVRALLRDAFTDRELVAFCQDRPALRPVLIDFGPRFSFAEMIDAVVSYAMRRDKLPELLAEIEVFNPAQFSRHRVPTPPGAEVDRIGFPRPHGNDYLFLLMDVSFQDERDTAELLECLFERWLPLLAPQHIVPKVFVPLCPHTCPVTPVTVEWSPEALYALLCHRLERAGLVRDDGQSPLQDWVVNTDDAGWALVRAADGLPERLIRLGNRLIARLGQPDPLGVDEFTSLLAKQ